MTRQQLPDLNLLDTLYVHQGTIALCSWESKPFSVRHECAVILHSPQTQVASSNASTNQHSTKPAAP